MQRDRADQSALDAWMGEQGEALFAAQLAIGDRHCRAVTERIRAETGLPVHSPRSRMRSCLDDRRAFEQEVDIIVGEGVGARRLEVKSRDLRFSDSPRSYPYQTAFVDTRSGWDKKVVKPVALVLVSQQTGAMLALNVERSRHLWVPRISGDKVRGFRDERYEVPRSELRSMRRFIEWLVS